MTAQERWNARILRVQMNRRWSWDPPGVRSARCRLCEQKTDGASLCDLCAEFIDDVRRDA